MSIPRSELPLALNAEVETPDGKRYQWGPDRPGAGDRFKGLNFTTAIGEGFSSGGVALSRPTDRDFADLRLLNKVTFTGADGSTAYQARISSMPRDVTQAGHNIGVTLAGLMANASDRKFNEIYVDRDLSGWQPASLGRRLVILGSSYTPNDAGSYVDPTDSQTCISTGFQGPWGATYYPMSESWYDAGPGATISKVAYSWRKTPTIVAVAPWSWSLYVSSDDKGTASSSSGNLLAAGPSSGVLSPTVRYRFAALNSSYSGTGIGVGTEGNQYDINWYNLAVYGNHGLTLYTGEAGQPQGVRAADVIRDVITRFCPQLVPGDIAAADYVIQHLVYKDEGITPYEAMLQVNKYHLYNLAVWEDGRLDWKPFDLTDYDWQVRMGEDCEVSLQGASTDNVFNGIVVRYNDILTGIKNVLTPDNYTDLKDTSPNNPWNQQGIQRWTEIELSYPHTAGGALQAGRAALIDGNRAKSPGSITSIGYVRDRAGNRQPGWKVRAGDTVAIVNHPNDAPRLIQGTSWDDEAKTQTLSVDAPPSSLEAQQDRVMTALKARGLL